MSSSRGADQTASLTELSRALQIGIKPGDL
jgi:hypothetical protein